MVTDGPAIDRLNDRLRRGGVTLPVFPEGREQDPTSPFRQRLFVAADEDEIRGAVWLREHLFRVPGTDLTLGWLKYPVAESLVNPVYSGVPGSLLLTCLREQPRLLGLGLGGLDTPLSRMLARLGWKRSLVPLFLYLVRPATVLSQIEVLRRSTWRRRAATVLAVSGLARVIFNLAQWRLPSAAPSGPVEIEAVADFGEWADEVWRRDRDSYGFLARRDRLMLEKVIPQSPDLQRLRIRHRGEDLGWACVVRHDFSQGRPDPNFGRLTVGLIADGLCAPANATRVVKAAVQWLRVAGTDLIISNQAHPAWIRGLRSLGFLPGPSNFAFVRAPAAEHVLNQASVLSGGRHLNRGDLDGPLWYVS
jgi:hypothetical protein